jgi:hypothetical protein
MGNIKSKLPGLKYLEEKNYRARNEKKMQAG